VWSDQSVRRVEPDLMPHPQHSGTLIGCYASLPLRCHLYSKQPAKEGIGIRDDHELTSEANQPLHGESDPIKS
jgi:hypothetical protein